MLPNRLTYNLCPRSGVPSNAMTPAYISNVYELEVPSKFDDLSLFDAVAVVGVVVVVVVVVAVIVRQNRTLGLAVI